VFALLGLAVIVCTVTMLGLKPWEPDESLPSLAQPAFEARVGDGVAVPTVGPAVAVVQAAVAPGRAELVGTRGARPGKGESERREGAPAVGPALAVVAPASKKTGGAPESAPPTEGSPPAEAPPAGAPAPELASVPATPPSASPPAKTPGGPVAVGTPGAPAEEEEEPAEGEEQPAAEEPGAGEEACAGDEYTLTITPLEAEGEAVTIVLEHLAADGGTETLELAGNLEDARSLVLRLSSEGGCVEVEVVSPLPTTP
jgi:hypothetical protein